MCLAHKKNMKCTKKTLDIVFFIRCRLVFQIEFSPNCCSFLSTQLFLRFCVKISRKNGSDHFSVSSSFPSQTNFRYLTLGFPALKISLQEISPALLDTPGHLVLTPPFAKWVKDWMKRQEAVLDFLSSTSSASAYTNYHCRPSKLPSVQNIIFFIPNNKTFSFTSKVPQL